MATNKPTGMLSPAMSDERAVSLLLSAKVDASPAKNAGLDGDETDSTGEATAPDTGDVSADGGGGSDADAAGAGKADSPDKSARDIAALPRESHRMRAIPAVLRCEEHNMTFTSKQQLGAHKRHYHKKPANGPADTPATLKRKAAKDEKKSDGVAASSSEPADGGNDAGDESSAASSGPPPTKKQKRTGRPSGWKEADQRLFCEAFSRFGRDWVAVTKWINAKSREVNMNALKTFASTFLIKLHKNSIPLPDRFGGASAEAYSLDGKTPVNVTSLTYTRTAKDLEFGPPDWSQYAAAANGSGGGGGSESDAAGIDGAAPPPPPPPPIVAGADLTDDDLAAELAAVTSQLKAKEKREMELKSQTAAAASKLKAEKDEIARLEAQAKQKRAAKLASSRKSLDDKTASVARMEAEHDAVDAALKAAERRKKELSASLLALDD